MFTSISFILGLTELSDIPLGELQALREKIGTKKFDIVLQKSREEKEKRSFKRVNKNRYDDKNVLLATCTHYTSYSTTPVTVMIFRVFFLICICPLRIVYSFFCDACTKLIFVLLPILQTSWGLVQEASVSLPGGDPCSQGWEHRHRPTFQWQGRKPEPRPFQEDVFICGGYKEEREGKNH